MSPNPSDKRKEQLRQAARRYRKKKAISSRPVLLYLDETTKNALDTFVAAQRIKGDSFTLSQFIEQLIRSAIQSGTDAESNTSDRPPTDPESETAEYSIDEEDACATCIELRHSLKEALYQLHLYHPDKVPDPGTIETLISNTPLLEDLPKR